MRVGLGSLVVSAMLFTACRDACQQACVDFGEFLDECWDELEEADIGANCIEPQDIESAVTAEGGLDYDYVSICTTARDARRTCLDLWKHRLVTATDSEIDGRLEECEEDSEYNRLIREEDCTGMVELVAGP